MRTLKKEVNGRNISFIPLNASVLRVRTDGIADVEYSDKYKQQICTVILNGDYRLTLHGMIKIPSEDRVLKYPINDITQVNPKEFNLTAYKRNKTTKYLLPLLGSINLSNYEIKDISPGNRSEYSKYCMNTYLINAYISAKKPKCIYLVYRFSEHPTYKIFESILHNHPKFIKIIEHHNEEFVIFEMDLGEGFKEDIKLFKRGYYSEMSNESKISIMRFYTPRAFPQTYRHILNILRKHPSLREELSQQLAYELPEEAELDDKPFLEEEYIEFL